MKARAQVTASAKTATAPAAARMPQPPAAVPDRADDQPDVAAQLASASRLGHNFAALGVDGAGPPPLQPKLVVGPVGDRYEREADWVVGHALSLHNGPAPSAAQPVQRQEEWNTTIRGEAEAPGEGSRAPEVCQENRTGLPDHLKAGLEHLSGLAMDDVKVHYNSDKPTQLQAHAYAQGTNINIAPGQEKHLPHEAWHVVQQKQGRVKPTVQMTGGVNVNDDEGLEREADVMGEKAKQLKTVIGKEIKTRHPQKNTIQRAVPEKCNENPHPRPETGTYKAASGQGEIFNKESHPRSRFSFGKYTRNEVLEKFPHSKIGNRIVAVQDQDSGQMVNVEGIHLDHIFSWDKISEIMNSDKDYTFYEAKMYYNDQSNLHPVLGGLNSAAGSSGVGALEETYPEFNEQIARIQTSWMNLQNYITAVYVQEEGNIAPQGLLDLLDHLKSIENKLDEGLEY